MLAREPVFATLVVVRNSAHSAWLVASLALYLSSSIGLRFKDD